MRHPRTVLALLILAVSPTPAPADAPQRLTVATAGEQQRSVTVAARGDCFDVYDAAEANGEPEPCGGGSWPGAGGDWGPALEVPGGAKLVLTGDAPFEGAELTATTNFPLGLTTPDGAPVRNETLAGPLEAEAVDEDRRSFTVELPRLDPRAVNGLAVAVVVRSEDVERHFAFAIRPPQPAGAGTATKGPPPVPAPARRRPRPRSSGSGRRTSEAVPSTAATGGSWCASSRTSRARSASPRTAASPAG